MTNIDFSSWRTTNAHPNVFGKTIKIDGNSYSIEITRTNESSLWMFQRGQYDKQHGRFGKQLRSGSSDTFEDGYKNLLLTVMSYASFVHDIDLVDWLRNFNSATETYWKSVELGDRAYAVEIRRLSETKSEWRINQGDYDGASDNFDAEVMSGKSRTLKDAFVSAKDACENFEPPAPHIY